MLPPPHGTVGFCGSLKTSATTPPPPPNRVGFWRSRKRLKKFNNLNLADLVLNFRFAMIPLPTLPAVHQSIGNHDKHVSHSSKKGYERRNTSYKTKENIIVSRHGSKKTDLNFRQINTVTVIKVLPLPIMAVFAYIVPGIIVVLYHWHLSCF